MEISSATPSLPAQPSFAARSSLVDLKPGTDIVTEFESLIVADLLKTMRSASEDGGMFAGDKSDTYGGMFDMYFGRFIAENGGLGMKDLLEKALHREPAADGQNEGTPVVLPGREVNQSNEMPLSPVPQSTPSTASRTTTTANPQDASPFSRILVRFHE